MKTGSGAVGPCGTHTAANRSRIGRTGLVSRNPAPFGARHGANGRNAHRSRCNIVPINSDRYRAVGASKINGSPHPVTKLCKFNSNCPSLGHSARYTGDCVAVNVPTRHALGAEVTA